MQSLSKVILFIIIILLRNSAYAQVWDKLFIQADSLFQKAQYKAAYPIYQKAEEQAKIEFGDHYNTAKTLQAMATTLQIQGDYPAAEQKFIAARNLYSTVAPTSIERVEVTFYLGQIYRNQARYSRADSSMRDGIRLAASLPKPSDRKTYGAYGLANLGNLYRVMDDNRRAKPLIIQALAIQDSLTGKLNSEYASYLGSLAGIYDNLEEYTLAEPLFLEAIAIRKQLSGENSPSITLILNNLANHYMYLGDFSSALPLLSKSLSIRSRTGAKGQGYYESIQNMALCYQNLNQSKKADSLYNEALLIAEKQVGKTNPNYIKTLNSKATGLYKTKRYTDASLTHIQALSLAQTTGTENELYAQVLNNASDDYLALNDFTKADSLNTTALAISQRISGENSIPYTTYLFTKGRIRYARSDTKTGIDLMEQSLRKYDRILQQNYLSMTARQKIAFSDKWKRQYANYFSVVMDSKLVGDSYDVTLSQKNALLNEYSQIANLLNQLGTSFIKTQLDSLIKVKTVIATQYTLPIAQRQHLDSLEARAEKLEKDLARQSAPFREAQRALQIHWKDIRDALKPAEAAVEFVSFPYHNGRQQTDSVRYMALILRPGDKTPHVVPLLTDETPLRRLLEHKKGVSGGAALYATRGSELDTDQITRGDSVYQLIWRPIDGLLTGTKTVYLAPSGLLHQVSFAALPYRGNSAPGNPAKKRPQYLADRYQLRQVGSTRQVAIPATDDDTYQSIASAKLYGGIQYDSVGAKPGLWPFLPGTQREVEQIGQFMGPKAILVTGKDATETDLKKLSGKSPTVLHIATHGFAFPDPIVARNDTSENQGGTQFRQMTNPLFRTGVLMAGATHVWQGGRPVIGEDDGILTAYEVANLNLSATKVVVLSACETALGDIQGSEGVFGLQRAFKMAGAGYLLTSLWPVADQATSELMTQFYRNWKQYKTIRAAFLQTQLQMRQKYPPSVWASFVLIE